MKRMQEQYIKEVIPRLMKDFGHKTPMAVPRIVKVVINSGIGKIRDNKDAVATVERHLALIAGQKVSPRVAKRAIASFKSREGMVVGYAATLSGKRMYDFLERLVRLAIPRMRDFRGISQTSVDHAGNLTFGIKEHIVFPEMIGEDVKHIFSFEVTVVTNARRREEALELFSLLGFPFKHNV